MKTFNIKIVLTLLIILTGIGTSFAQNDTLAKSIKPLRFGVKIGVPHLFTANAEYVTPLLGNRVAVAVDYMSLSKTVDATQIKYNNFEIGTNIYLNKKGKGLYGGISYFSFDGDGTYTDVDFDDGSTGTGTGNIKFNTFNFKLGYKVGRTFFVRFEIGYGFGDIPEYILVTSTSGSQTTKEEIPDIPGISTSGLLVMNFGFGFGLF